MTAHQPCPFYSEPFPAYADLTDLALQGEVDRIEGQPWRLTAWQISHLARLRAELRARVEAS